MIKLGSSVLSVLLFALPATSLAQSIKGRNPLSTKALSQTTWIEAFDVSPDGRQVAFKSAKSGVYNIWTAPVAGGAWKQMTFHPIPYRGGSDTGPTWSPDGRWIAYPVDKNVKRQGRVDDIYVVPAAGGEPKNLTNASYSTESDLQWSPDSKEIAFVSSIPASILNEIEPLMGGGIVRVNVESGAMRRISPRGGGDLQWSPDGKYFAYTGNRDRNSRTAMSNGDIFMTPAEGGDEKLLTPNTVGFRERDPDWSPDSRKLAFTTDRNGWDNIATVDVQTGEVKVLTNRQHDHSNPTWSPDGRWIAYVVNEEYNFYVEMISPNGGNPIRVTTRKGVSGGMERSQVRGTLKWTPDSKQIVYTYMAPSTTVDLWISDAAANAAPKRITDSREASMKDEGQFVWPELIRYKSFDGLDVQGFVYKPKGVVDGDKAPLVLFYRANSNGLHPVGWQPYIQYYVSKGYVVFAPNFRGSVGNGKKYDEIIYGHGGDHDVKDALRGVELLIQRGLIDRNRMGMVGGSTGGYFVNATLILEPTLFKAGVSWYTGGADMAARADFDRGGEFGWTGRMMGGSPLTNPVSFYNKSLIYFVEHISTPLLLLYDEGDVFWGGVTILVPALAKFNKEYAYKQYMGEPHGWYHWRPENVEDSLNRIGEFLDRKVLGIGVSSSQPE